MNVTLLCLKIKGLGKVISIPVGDFLDLKFKQQLKMVIWVVFFSCLNCMYVCIHISICNTPGRKETLLKRCVLMKGID